jgi:molecular chaperone GrpE
MDQTSTESAGTAGPGAAPDSSGADQAAGAGGASTADAGELQRQLEELRDRHVRLVAEFDNYRKRTERERSESWVKAQGQLVEKLLEAVDDLERVADYTEESTSVAALLEGVQMVERKLLRSLEAAGLERVDAHGAPFNPQEHEALMTASTEHPHEDETVGEVFQKGYRFQGHLLRPARVQVRKHEG